MENGKIVIYRTADGETSIDVKLENDTVWLTQAQMAELFQKDQSVIARHIRNVFKEGELEEMSNMQILHNTFPSTSLLGFIVLMSLSQSATVSSLSVVRNSVSGQIKS